MYTVIFAVYHDPGVPPAVLAQAQGSEISDLYHGGQPTTSPDSANGAVYPLREGGDRRGRALRPPSRLLLSIFPHPQEGWGPTPYLRPQGAKGAKMQVLDSSAG